MEGLREPVGELPPEVYWKRRAVVFIGMAILIAVLWFLITSPAGTDPNSNADPAPTTSAPPVQTSEPPVDLTRPCTDEDVNIVLTANPRAVGSGSLPTFEATVEHTGTSPCSLVTDEDSEFYVNSGADDIFFASDCPANSPFTEQSYLLSDGASENFELTWNRQRSAPDCGTSTADPRPGTYRATATVQGIVSNIAVFELTD